MLAHNVYFSLHDRTPAARERLMASCREHLNGHPGAVFFAVGAPVPDLARPVNDRDFDVHLCMVFADRAAHDAYQAHPRHLRFMDGNRAGWARVRVFDSDVA